MDQDTNFSQGRFEGYLAIPTEGTDPLVQSAEKLIDESLPSNGLMKR